VTDLRESISLRTDDGLFFGELLRFELGRMEVECDGRFDLRTEVEFQLKLPGFNATVYGIAKVLRAISKTAVIRQYSLRLLRMRDKDRLLLQQWVDYSVRGRSQEQSNTSPEAPATDRELAANPWGVRSLDSAVRTEAGRSAMRDALRARFTPSSTASAASLGGTRRSGRASLREGLSRAGSSGGRSASDGSGDRGRHGISEAIRTPPTPSSGPRRRGQPDTPDKVGSKQAPPRRRPRRRKGSKPSRPPLAEVAPADESPQLPHPKDPQVHLRLAAAPPQVFVRYHTRSGYFGDYQSYLSKNVLFLQNTTDTPKKGSVLKVNVFLPSGLSVVCVGTVIATLPNGFGLNLQLDAEARMTLASAARL